MRIIHVVNEDYEHYIKRKRNKLKFWIPAIIIISLTMIFFIIKDFEKNYPQEPQPETIYWLGLYTECMEMCNNTFSEGEEMTKACEIIKKDQSKLMRESRLDCMYKSIIKICSCLKENKLEEECQEVTIEYLKEIGCAK